jgi:hypothetical protein
VSRISDRFEQIVEARNAATGEVAGLKIKAHMLRHACGYKLVNDFSPSSQAASPR